MAVNMDVQRELVKAIDRLPAPVGRQVQIGEAEYAWDQVAGTPVVLDADSENPSSVVYHLFENYGYSVSGVTTQDSLIDLNFEINMTSLSDPALTWGDDVVDGILSGGSMPISAGALEIADVIIAGLTTNDESASVLYSDDGSPRDLTPHIAGIVLSSSSVDYRDDKHRVQLAFSVYEREVS